MPPSSNAINLRRLNGARLIVLGAEMLMAWLVLTRLAPHAAAAAAAHAVRRGCSAGPAHSTAPAPPARRRRWRIVPAPDAGSARADRTAVSHRRGQQPLRPVLPAVADADRDLAAGLLRLGDGGADDELLRPAQLFPPAPAGGPFRTRRGRGRAWPARARHVVRLRIQRPADRRLSACGWDVRCAIATT